LDRREDGGAGADDDAGLAAADAVPLLGALVGGELRVEEGDSSPKAAYIWPDMAGVRPISGREERRGLRRATRCMAAK
jgi:hypothetical protein